MDYKKFCKIFAVSAIVIMGLVIGFEVAVDPLGIIGSPIIRGFNHYKSKQDVFQHIWKPYLVIENRPDVVFIGSSRVVYGWKPSLDGYNADKVFNLAFNALTFYDMDTYLNLVYKIHIPQKIFIGIDFIQFGKEFHSERANKHRLNVLIANDKDYFANIISDYFKIHNVILPTILESIMHKDKELFYCRGWNVDVQSKVLGNHEDRSTIKSFSKRYDEFVYDKESLEKLKKIIESAKNKGIKVYVFVNPVHRRLYELLCNYGHEEKWKAIKKEVELMAGKLYELKNADRYIGDNNLFCDHSHYNAKLGEILKAQILADN